MVQCEFCGCSPLEPCIDFRTGWRCEQLFEDGICSACIADEVTELEPTAVELATDVKVGAAYL